MDRFALKKCKKRPKSDNAATKSANPHVVRAPQAESTNDRFSTSSWLAAEPLPRQNRGSQGLSPTPPTGWDSVAVSAQRYPRAWAQTPCGYGSPSSGVSSCTLAHRTSDPGS